VHAQPFHAQPTACARHAGHVGAAQQPRRRKRSRVEYHPGARFDGGRAPSAQHRSQDGKRHDSAADSATDGGGPAGSERSSSSRSGSAAGRDMQPSALSAEPESPAATLLDSEQKTSARPNRAARSTASGSLPPIRSDQRGMVSRRRANSAAARHSKAQAAQAAATTAQAGEHAHRSSSDQVVGTGGLAQPKRLRRSRAARVRSVGPPSPEARHANPKASNPVAANLAPSQVRTWSSVSRSTQRQAYRTSSVLTFASLGSALLFDVLSIDLRTWSWC